jgi:energy-converting hydrogenase Eha subunit H
VALAVWSLSYAGYRAYYAAGGEMGLLGEPVSRAQYRSINAVGAAIIFVAGLLPLLALRVRVIRRALPVVCWIAAVGCCMHALVDFTLRIFSLTGVHPTQLPASVWRSFDRRTADLQDLLLNEPWFFIEGLLWATLGVALVHPSRRRPWVATAAIACLLLTIVGVLSGLGVIGSFYFG